MRLAHLALLFISISLPLYLIGYPSAFVQLMNKQSGAGFDITAIIEDIVSRMTNLTFAAQVFGVALGIVVLSGFSAIYVIPALIFSLLFNYILIPAPILINGQCAPSATAVLQGCDIINVLTTLLSIFILLAWAEFVTGR